MMKKLLYGFAVIAGLASCNDDYTDWAAPQSNAANEAVEKFTLTAQSSVASIDFVTATAESVQLFTTNLQAGQTGGYSLVISDEDQTETATVEATVNGEVALADLKQAVVTVYGRAPIERTLAVKVVADVTISTADGVIVTEKEAAPFALKATLEMPHVSTGYYLVGDHCGWDAAGMMKFSHSGQDVYEDPVFTLEFTTTKAESYWKIIPQENVDGDFWANPGVVGPAVNGLSTATGALVEEDAQAGMVEAAGTYRMTINMMDYRYTIEKVNP